ncbi:MAG: IS91 family transposase [Proteobacteria bacterium]|nr:IS91 family transposase [Pseudomonadota bacterium]
MTHLEVADIVRDRGDAFARTRRLSLGQLKALSAIERCRSAELGGHVLACQSCGETHIAYNSCRNRHCPKCQGSAAKRWLADRQAELLPVEYYHIVFTLPALVADVAFQNPASVYNLLFKVTAQTLRTIAADPKHLGVDIGVTAVLHTWGSAMTHHPHLHCVVPGGGLTPQGQWLPCKRGYLLPVPVLSRLFRRLFLEQLIALHPKLKFYGALAPLVQRMAFKDYLKPVRQVEWVVYAKRPFAGPEAVFSYLALYTHRIAISNQRLIAYDHGVVTFKYKDYRRKGRERYRSMQLHVDEFLRRFLIHVLPLGFHRIRYFGLFANHQRRRRLQQVRETLNVPPPEVDNASEDTERTKPPVFVCRTCGVGMIILQVLDRSRYARAPP